MASRKGMHVYIPKYFMAVKNCVPSRVRSTSQLTCSFTGVLLMCSGRKFESQDDQPFIVFILIQGFCLRFVKKKKSNLQPLGQIRRDPK